MAEKTIATPLEGQETTQTRETTREEQRFVTPPVDIYETNEGLVLLADIPGVTAERLSVDVKDDVLTIEARTEIPTEGTAVYREFELPNFFREFQLSDQVDVSKITASLKHGVLTLKLPKAEAAKPKTIQVQVE